MKSHPCEPLALYIHLWAEAPSRRGAAVRQKEIYLEQEAAFHHAGHYDSHYGLGYVGPPQPYLLRPLHGMAEGLARPVHHRLAHRILLDDGGVAGLDGTRQEGYGPFQASPGCDAGG